jgi:hypothetical protein
MNKIRFKKEFANENGLLPDLTDDDGDRLDALCSAIRLECRPKLPYTNAVVNVCMGNEKEMPIICELISFNSNKTK